MNYLALRNLQKVYTVLSRYHNVWKLDLFILAVINMPIWCLWNRLQNVLENCLFSIHHCQLQKHQGSWETEMTKNYSIQIKKRYFLLWVNKGLLLCWISLIEAWPFFIYFLLQGCLNYIIFPFSLCLDYVDTLMLPLQEHWSQNCKSFHPSRAFITCLLVI